MDRADDAFHQVTLTFLSGHDLPAIFDRLPFRSNLGRGGHLFQTIDRGAPRYRD